MHRLSICAVLVRVCQGSGSTDLPNAELSTADYDRIVIIPDVHGDADAALRSLLLALTEIEYPKPMPDLESFNATFNEAIDHGRFPETPLSVTPSVALVQMGDLVDRGPYSFRCIDIFQVAHLILGWPVLKLFGNHEIMNMHQNAGMYIHERERDPEGGFEKRYAPFSPNGGRYHSLLAGTALGVVRLTSNTHEYGFGDLRNPNTLFVHAGVDLAWLRTHTTAADANGVNEWMREQISSEEGVELLEESDSIVWTRGQAWGDEWISCGRTLDAVLQYFNVARIVVGHTPQTDRLAKTRCEGRVILTDAMMSRWMLNTWEVGKVIDEAAMVDGRPIAVIMQMDPEGALKSIVAHYTDLKTGKMIDARPLFESKWEECSQDCQDAAPTPLGTPKSHMTPKDHGFVDISLSEDDEYEVGDYGDLDISD